MNKNENFEQVPVRVTFYTMNQIGKSSYSESFGRNGVQDIVKRLIFLKNFTDKLLKDEEEKAT